MLPGMSCWNFKKIWPVVFEFLRPQENVTSDVEQNPGATKIPFPYERRIKTHSTSYLDIHTLNIFRIFVNYMTDT